MEKFQRNILVLQIPVRIILYMVGYLHILGYMREMTGVLRKQKGMSSQHGVGYKIGVSIAAHKKLQCELNLTG